MPRLKYYNPSTEQWEYVVVGAQGEQGEQGDIGPANTLTVGTVADSAPGSEPEVTITGTAPNQTINFVLPTGDTGPQGETGNTGVVQQSGTPSSTDVLWLDTDEVADVPVPNGGTTGQVLTKSSNDDYDTEWTTLNASDISDITASATALNSTSSATSGLTALSNGTSGITYQPVSHNVIINGGMDVAQRGTSFTTGSGGGARFYAADRFYTINYQWTSGSNITVANDTSVFPTGTGIYNSYRVSTGATGLTFGSGGVGYIKTFIEGSDAEVLYGKTVTLSFYVRSNITGIYNLFLENGTWESGPTTNRAFSPTYTINSANTWERKTIVLDMATAVSAGTWNTTNDIGLGISWMLGAHSDRTGSSYNSNWATYSAATPQSNLATQFMTNANSNFYLTGVQLEVGSVATPFKRNAPSIQAELAACQRYYEKSYGPLVAPGTATGESAVYQGVSSDQYANGTYTVVYKVTKRAVPSIAYWSINGVSGVWDYNRSGVGNTNSSGSSAGWIGQNQSLAYFGVGAAHVPCTLLGQWAVSAEL